MKNFGKKNSANVIDLGLARKRLAVSSGRGGRPPLFKTHSSKGEESLADRMVNVQESLEKINKLMAELKRSSRPSQTPVKP